MKEDIDLNNCLFVFESEKDLIYFWNQIMGSMKKSRITNNTFLVIKDNWILKILKWVLRHQ